MDFANSRRILRKPVEFCEYVTDFAKSRQEFGILNRSWEFSMRFAKSRQELGIPDRFCGIAACFGNLRRNLGILDRFCGNGGCFGNSRRDLGILDRFWKISSRAGGSACSSPRRLPVSSRRGEVIQGPTFCRRTKFCRVFGGLSPPSPRPISKGGLGRLCKRVLFCSYSAPGKVHYGTAESIGNEERIRIHPGSPRATIFP